METDRRSPLGTGWGPRTGRPVQRTAKVFDILNAGPRHRFTVSGVLVSNCVEILDFVGNAGRHRLITSADILGGNYPDDVVDRARQNLASAVKGEPCDVQGALIDAEAELREERKRREAAEHARRARLRPKARYKATDAENPFDVLDITPWRERGWDRGRQPSDRMRDCLRKNGIDPEGLPYGQAKQLIETIVQRGQSDKCTFKQARLLQRFGYPADATFAEARGLIDRIAGNGWKRPDPQEPTQ